jgi:hypothetical protein
MQPSKNGTLDASAASSIVRPGIGQGFSAVRGVNPDTLPGGSRYGSRVTITALSLSVSPGDFGYWWRRRGRRQRDSVDLHIAWETPMSPRPQNVAASDFST